jgi:hypothetical protein
MFRGEKGWFPWLTWTEAVLLARVIGMELSTGRLPGPVRVLGWLRHCWCCVTGCPVPDWCCAPSWGAACSGVLVPGSSLGGGRGWRKSLASFDRSEGRALGVCGVLVGVIGPELGGQAFRRRQGRGRHRWFLLDLPGGSPKRRSAASGSMATASSPDLDVWAVSSSDGRQRHGSVPMVWAGRVTFVWAGRTGLISTPWGSWGLPHGPRWE